MWNVNLSTVIAAVVGVLAGAAAKGALTWAKSAFGAITTALRPDHKALSQRPAWSLVAVSGGTNGARLVIACAPARSLRRTGIDPDAGIQFIHKQFPGRFPVQPALSDQRTGVKFTADPGGGTQDGYAWAWSTGRVDLSTYVQPIPDSNGHMSVPLSDILRSVALVAEAVVSPAYAQAFPGPRWPFRRRFDWFIGVSGDYTRTTDGATVPWDDLGFPGRRPQRAGSQQYPYCPPAGFAHQQLRNWDPRRPITDLLKAFLEDFLKTNGYHDTSGAITDAINAWAENRLQPSARPRSISPA